MTKIDMAFFPSIEGSMTSEAANIARFRSPLVLFEYPIVCQVIWFNDSRTIRI